MKGHWQEEGYEEVRRMVLVTLALSYVGVLAVLIVECREKCRQSITLAVAKTIPRSTL